MNTFTEKIKKIPTEYYIILLTILGCIAVVYAFTGLWPWKENPYNSYSLQAQAWLDGHLDLGQDYPWLELAIYDGKYFVSFPPFPSFVLLPFAILFKSATPDHFIALAVTCIGAIYAAKIYKKVCKSLQSIIFFVLFLFLASGFVFIGINGYVWFIAQNMCFTLSLMSIYYALEAKGGLSFSLWACAVGCRPMTILWLPILIMLVYRSVYRASADGSYKLDFAKKISESQNYSCIKKMIELIKNRWYWCVGPVIIASVYMILNYKRFGNIFEFGHNYLPEFTSSDSGQFSISYLWENLNKLLHFPDMNPENGAIAFPNAEGFAFYIAAPIFLVIIGVWLYALLGKRKHSTAFLILVPIITVCHVVFICLHKTLGGWGFGNRYLLDILPWLYLFMLAWKPKNESFVKWITPVAVFGCALNLIGTVAVYNYWI